MERQGRPSLEYEPAGASPGRGGRPNQAVAMAAWVAIVAFTAAGLGTLYDLLNGAGRAPGWRWYDNSNDFTALALMLTPAAGLSTLLLRLYFRRRLALTAWLRAGITAATVVTIAALAAWIIKFLRAGQYVSL